MRAEHPAPALLQRFLRCEVSPAESRAVVLHLLAGCAKCRAVTRPVWETVDRFASQLLSHHTPRPGGPPSLG